MVELYKNLAYIEYKILKYSEYSHIGEITNFWNSGKKGCTITTGTLFSKYHLNLFLSFTVSYSHTRMYMEICN